MLDTKPTVLSFRDDPEQALAAYHEHGCHIEPDVFSDDECAALIAASQQLSNAKNGSYRPEMMPHLQAEIYLQAMRKPNLVQIMNLLVAGTAQGLQTEFFYCKPGTRGFSLHQDNFFVQAPFGAFASAWIALTDTYAEKGGLIAYPGSHKEGELPVRKLQMDKALTQDPNANNEETIVPGQYKPVNVSVPKGAVFFIHGHVVHGSNPNITDEWRYVLLNTYIRKGESFRPGNYAQRKAIDL